MAKNVDAALTEAQDALAAINQYLESAGTSAAAAKESQTQAATVLADTQSKLAEISSAATEATAAQTKIVDLQTVIAAKSEHIEDARMHADKVRADLDGTLTEAKQQATEADSSKTRAQAAADGAAQILAAIQTTKGSAETDADAIGKAREIAEESAEITKGLSDKAGTIEGRVAEYESRLSDLQGQCVERLKTIDSLLPGATSAGLAHSLDKRRQTFLTPQKRWQAVFICSLLAIIAVAVNGLLHVYQMKIVPHYDELVRLWLARLPVAGALLWLALHASREAALAKRLEEDYGYKSAIASSFEGFRRQMADISVELQSDSPLAKLCGDTLTILAAPPGRIYDKHKLTVSPLDELRESAKTLTESAKPIADVAKTLKIPGSN
jgi:hypothetical protein